MDPALFRITLLAAKGPPENLGRRVAAEDLNSAVLCARQWVVWSHAKDRGRRAKYGSFRVEIRDDAGSWRQVAEGTLKDARLAWTKEDDARIEEMPDVRPLYGATQTTRHGKVQSIRGESRPKSRLAALVQEMQRRK